MSDDDERVSLAACALPGSVTVTPLAMKLAERFQTVVPKGWIAAFWWYDGGRTRPNKDAPWTDTGPGVDLGAYRINEIPDAAICHSESIRYAILIRKEILSKYPENTIDVDETGRLILR